MNQIEWRISDEPVAYPDALAFMEDRVEAIRAGTAAEMVWLLEHPPLYTAGTSARPEDLIDARRFPVFKAGRGGQYTYHGPGQRVAYVMLDLRRRTPAGATPDIRGFVGMLEEWIIRSLAQFNIKGERRDGRVGIWVDRAAYGGLPGTEDKIAAIGVRIRRWVTFHGIAINVEPDLDHFRGIVPCGISEHGVTSIAALGHLISMPEMDTVMRETWDGVFEAPVKPSVAVPA